MQIMSLTCRHDICDTTADSGVCVCYVSQENVLFIYNICPFIYVHIYNAYNLHYVFKLSGLMVVSTQTEHYNLHVMDTYGRAVELDSISFRPMYL